MRRRGAREAEWTGGATAPQPSKLISLIAVFVDDVPEGAADRGIANITSLLGVFLCEWGQSPSPQRGGPAKILKSQF